MSSILVIFALFARMLGAESVLDKIWTEWEIDE